LQETRDEHHGKNGCPDGCCVGDEILCISIPCPITIVLLGIQLQVELPCLRITSPDELNGEHVNQLLGIVSALLGNLGESLQGDE
jgi:hypothetical protein